MSHPALAQTYAPTPFQPSAAALGARRYGQPAASPFATQAARYRDAELQTATPGQLIALLYDAMLRNLGRARIACEAKQIEVRCEQIVKAGEMIGELQISLDHQAGGDISKQLDALYGFMLKELYEANRKQDATKIDVVIKMASELREAFAQVAHA